MKHTPSQRRAAFDRRRFDRIHTAETQSAQRMYFPPKNPARPYLAQDR